MLNTYLQSDGGQISFRGRKTDRIRSVGLFRDLRGNKAKQGNRCLKNGFIQKNFQKRRCVAQMRSCVPDESANSLSVLEGDSATSFEAAAIRAIRQAELEYREAARKLLQAQSKLESARLMAEEITSLQGNVAEKLVDNSVSPDQNLEHKTVQPEYHLQVSGDGENLWRESVNVVEAVFEAEERRQEGIKCFRKAAEALRRRLTEDPVKASINDRHIELLDSGGQYHVAQWVVKEMEDCLPEGSGTELVVSINLDLALQGYDHHLVQFLQDLPYDQVLGIRTSVKSKNSILVDYCDGSSWESDFADRAMHGEDVEILSSPYYPPWSHRRELEKLPPPAIDVDVLEERIVPEGPDAELVAQLSSLLPVPAKKTFPPVVWSPLRVSLPNFFGKRELAVCAASFSCVLVAMLKTCELATLVADAFVLSFVAAFTFAVACAAGIVTPPMPAAVRKIVEQKWPHCVKPASSWDTVSLSSRPWDQLVLWMATSSAVLSSATASAIVVKAVQLTASFVYEKASASLPSFIMSQLSLGDISRITFLFMGAAGGNMLVSESLPFLISTFMWMLLILSVTVATSSASLMLVGYTSRIQESSAK